MKNFDLSKIREKNSFIILNHILNNQLSKAEISRLTGLTKTTVGDITNKMINLGIITEKEIVVGNIGRPARKLGLKADWTNIIGISIERDRLNVVLINSEKEVLYKKKFLNNKPFETFEILFEKITSLLDNTFNYAIKNNLKIDSIGVGAPGPFDDDGFIKNVPNFPACSNIPLKEILEERYNLDVWLGNDADMAALGERYFGYGKEFDSFIYVFLDKGIGAGIVKDLELYKGETGYAGELGQFIIHMEDKITFLEKEWSVDSILSKMKKYKLNKVTCIQDLKQELRNKNKIALLLIEEATKYIGGSILSLMYAMGISNIIVGGELSKLGKYLIKGLRKVIEENIIHEHPINVVLSNLDDYSISLGAAMYALVNYTMEKMKE